MTLPSHIALVLAGGVLAQALLPVAARMEVRTARQGCTALVAAALLFALTVHVLAAATGMDGAAACRACCSLLSGLLFGCVVHRAVCSAWVVPGTPTGRVGSFMV